MAEDWCLRTLPRILERLDVLNIYVCENVVNVIDHMLHHINKEATCSIICLTCLFILLAVLFSLACCTYGCLFSIGKDFHILAICFMRSLHTG